MGSLNKMEKIGNVAEFKRGPFGSSIKKAVCVSKGPNTFKLYEQGNVINNDFERDKYYLTKEKFNELNHFEIKTGDLLLTCAGTLGKIAIVPENIQRGIINSVLMRIRINENRVMRNYLYYYFQSPKIQNDITKQSAGVAIKNLFSTKLLKEYTLYLPDKDEQQLIVEEIEKQLTRLDASVKMFKEVKKKIEVYRKSVLKDLFNINCKYSIIGKVFKTTSGGTPSRSNKLFYQGSIPWLKSGELNDNMQILDSKEHVTSDALNKSSAKKFPTNTVLIAMYGATTGKLGIIRNECSTNQAICGIIPSENYMPKFIFYYLLFKRQYLINQSKGGAQPNISQGVIKSTLFPMINKEEQEQIVQGIESQFSVIDKLEETVDNSLKKTEQLKKSILKNAFEGKLVKGDNNVS